VWWPISSRSATEPPPVHGLDHRDERIHRVSIQSDDALAEKPVFSILVPSFNPGPFVERAMRSALSQMGADDELLVQDAGSTDGTVDTLRRLEDEDSRLKLVVEGDRGQSDALNLALARAKPSWVVWLNSDDVLLPGALDAVRDAIVSHPDADILYGATSIIREDGSVVEYWPGHEIETKRLMRQGCYTFSGSIIMRDTTLRALGGLNVEIWCAMDFDLQMRIAQSGLRQVKIPAPIGALRFHEGSKSANLWKKFIRESFHIRMKYSRNLRDKVYGVWGAAWQLAAVPVFRTRLTPVYRKIRRRVPVQVQ
jgi:glycosyltransferase involved in cell wall biosynthesis